MNAQEWYAHETGELDIDPNDDEQALLEDFKSHQVPARAAESGNTAAEHAGGETPIAITSRAPTLADDCQHCWHRFEGPIMMVVRNGEMVQECCLCGDHRVIHKDHAWDVVEPRK